MASLDPIAERNQPVTILVVDDDPGVARLMERTLRQQGYHTACVGSGREAIAWLEQHQADLLLLDLKLPDVGGPEIVEAMREMGRHVPFIIITGQGDERVAVDMMKRGALDYLVKDVNFMTLVPTVVKRAFVRIAENARLAAAEEMLRQSREGYRTLFNSLIEGFCIIKVIFDDRDRAIDYLFLEVNPAFERQTGLQNAQGKLMRELAPDHEAHWFEIYGRIALTGEPARFVNEAKALKRWYEVSAFRFGAAESRKVAILFNDISESKTAHDALRESERRERERAMELAAILDAVPTPIFIAHDPECLHITGNRAADDLLRNPRGAEASLTASEKTKPRHFKAVKDGRELSPDELPAQQAAHGIPVENFEFSLVFDDGSTREVLAYATPLLDDEGKPRGAINVLVDLSERKQAEAAVLSAIEQEQRRIGHDLHDGLGQELTAIAMLNNVVQKGIEAKGLPESATMARLAEMLKQATRQVRLISHGLQPVAAEPGGLMSGLRNLVAQTVTLPGVKCVFVCPEPVVVHAPASANHLYRIAQEAVQNALRHGNPRHVIVRLIREDDTVTLEVQDDGTGLSNQPDKTSGIGLTTMRYRADAIKGLLELVRPPKGGTLVRCSAPCPQVVPEKE